MVYLRGFWITRLLRQTSSVPRDFQEFSSDSWILSDKLQKKTYHNTFKVLKIMYPILHLKRLCSTKFVRTLLFTLFNENNKTPTLKVFKTDLTKVKGTKSADCYGWPTVCGLPQWYLTRTPVSQRKQRTNIFFLWDFSFSFFLFEFLFSLLNASETLQENV